MAGKIQITIILLTLTFCSFSQDSLKVKRDWSDFGFGTVSKGFFKSSAEAVNFTLNYNKQIGNAYYQAGINADLLTVDPYLSAIYVGIGKRLYNRFYLLSGFISPAIMWGNKEENGDEFKSAPFTTVGLSVSVQCIFKPLKDLGLGFELYSNLNFVQSTSGVVLVINLSNGK